MQISFCIMSTIEQSTSPAVRGSIAHTLLEPEHAVIARHIGLIRVVWIRMTRVMILDDMEAADVDVEMDVALLEIRRVGRPDLRAGIRRPDRSPGLAADAAAQLVGAHVEEVERVPPDPVLGLPGAQPDTRAV